MLIINILLLFININIFFVKIILIIIILNFYIKFIETFNKNKYIIFYVWYNYYK